MPIDVMGWEDAVSGVEDIVTGDDYTMLGDDLVLGEDEFVSGSDEELRNLLAAGDDLDVSGDDLVLSGARPLARARMTALAKRMAARAMKGKRGVAVKTRGISAARRYPLGFEATFDATHTEVLVTTRPQVPFRAERLTVPSAMGAASDGSPISASDYVIMDVKIGNRSQLVAAQPLPALIFAETAFGVAMRFDTAQVAQDITLSVRYVGANLGSGVTAPFRAALLGTAVF